MGKSKGQHASSEELRRFWTKGLEHAVFIATTRVFAIRCTLFAVLQPCQGLGISCDIVPIYAREPKTPYGPMWHPPPFYEPGHDAIFRTSHLQSVQYLHDIVPGSAHSHSSSACSATVTEECTGHTTLTSSDTCRYTTSRRSMVRT